MCGQKETKEIIVDRRELVVNNIVLVQAYYRRRYKLRLGSS